MINKIKQILKLLSAPLFLLAIYLLVMLIWKILQLPDGDQLAPKVSQYFNRFGLWVVFLSAIIEGTFLLGQYYPGGLVIFLGVIAAGNDMPKVITVVVIVCLAFFIGYTIDYYIGKYGWYKLLIKFGLGKSLNDAQAKLQKQGLNAVILSYWEPNLASIMATAAGILQMPLKKFLSYSLIGIIIWNTFWGTLVHKLGQSALKIMGIKYVLAIAGIWIVIILFKWHFFDKKSQINKLANIDTKNNPL